MEPTFRSSVGAHPDMATTPMSIEHLREITRTGAWKPHALALLSGSAPSRHFVGDFAAYWIEGGHHIRDQLADDRLLARLLRYALPPYEGPALTLWRGENRDRWQRRQIGFAWTSDLDVARMFGRGLHAVRSGALLLKGRFEPEAIISGPNRHSHYLGEGQFTVDPRYASSIAVVEAFPSAASQGADH